MQRQDNRLIRFVLGHALIGVLGGVAFALALVWLNLGGLRELVLASDVGFLALSIMLVFFGITFGSVQVGMALMLKRDWDDDEHAPPRKTAPHGANAIMVAVARSRV